MANIEITSTLTGSGYFTVNGGGVSRKSDVELKTGEKVAANYDALGKTITLTANATVGVVDSVGGWKIDLAKATGDARQATVKGSNDGAEVVGSSGNDSISLSGAKVTLALGSGADSVLAENDADKAYVDAGAGDDLITIKGESVTAYAGAGDDRVSINGANAKVYGEDGNDTILIGGGSAYVDGGDGNDTVSIGGTKATIYGGSGNDSIMVDGAEAYVEGGDGNDTVSVSGDKATIYGGAGNDSILAAGQKSYIDAGEGADIVSIGATDASVNAGAGNDSIVIAAGTAATVTLGAGKDTVSVGAQGVALTDYEYGTDTIVLGQALGSTSAKTGDVALTTDGMISATSGDVDVKITATDNYYKARLADSSNGDIFMSYAWASDTASTIDLSSEVNPFFVRADINDAADAVVGGRGNDTIYVGSGDVVNGGRGDDSISVAANATGVTVALSAGHDSIAGASVSASDNMFGFTDDDITLYVDDATNLKFGFDGASSALVASVKSATAQFTGAASQAGASIDLKVNAAGTTTNYEIVANGAVIDDEASILYGVASEGASVSVGAGAKETIIDLSNTHYFGDAHTYVNFNKIDASNSTSSDILIGAADAATTITAGKGSSTIFGVGSKADSLVGGDGDDTFVFGSGYGNDVVAQYGVKGDDQIIFLEAATNFTKDKEGNLTMAIGTDSLTVQADTNLNDKANKVYKLQVLGQDAFTAEVGVRESTNSFTYRDDVAAYFGGNKTDTLTLSGNDTYGIWLGNTYNGHSFTNIENVDASATGGEVVIWGATDTNSLIKAGTGDSTIFGGFGASGNDVLTGNSEGTTTFEFGLGCGNDTITSSKETDSIYLWNVSASDIDYEKTAAAISNRALGIVLTDGSTLTVQGLTDGVKTITISDNSKWKYNTETHIFEAVTE